MRSAQYCSLPCGLCTRVYGAANCQRNGWWPSAEIGTDLGKVAGIHAIAWRLHFIRKVQTGAIVPRNPLPLVYTVRKNQFLHSNLLVRLSYQAVRCPQEEKRTSCFSCMGGQESLACFSCIAGQHRPDRKECTLICSHMKTGGVCDTLVFVC